MVPFPVSSSTAKPVAVCIAQSRQCSVKQARLGRADALHTHWAPRRRRCRHRAHAQQQQQQEQQEQQQLGADNDLEEAFPDFQLPKFRPFTPQNALQRAMTSFRHVHECDGDSSTGSQTLLVMPLSADWVKAAADVLTDSFAESMAAMPYKNYLRRQVRQYLEAHMLLPPKAVVLVALLLPPLDASDAEQPDVGSRPAAAGDTGAASRGNGDRQASSSGSSGSGSEMQQPPQALFSSASPDADAELGDGMAMPLFSNFASLAGSSSSSSSSSDSDGEAPGVAPHGAVLAGVVELSFSASTRSKYLTLTPPEDRPYLCNMAIHPDHRGRGYGSALLSAAEMLVAQLGETEVYLHTRVQDLPAARLYKSAGYEEVASDVFLVRLLALDQRRLLRKRLAKPQQLP